MSNNPSLQSLQRITIAEFQELYPHLALFEKEKGWRCGNSFISYRAKCHKNQNLLYNENKQGIKPAYVLFRRMNKNEQFSQYKKFF